MVPKPNSRDKKYSPIFAETEEDEIVISGIAGKFPSSINITEFEKNLYNKVDMVSEGVFKNIDNMDLANRIGKTSNMSLFDSTFFGVHHKQAVSMDPQCRMLLETAYEAITDSGVNPKSLRGSNTGVFIAASYAESEKAWFYENILPGGFGITGCSRAMIANRISYCFGLTGPSFLVDTGGSGSTQALAIAYAKFRSGEIDSAIIGGTNLILFPTIDVQFKSLGMLSSDGYTRSFDKNSSGYNRCDTISCIFLQRKSNANRIYAHVVHCKSNHDGCTTGDALTFSKGQRFELMNQFYKEIKINPNEIAYIEANGNAIQAEDIAECDIIDNVICKKRKDPLLIGSVKSNVGHGDAAAGVLSVVKVCLAFENGKIPPNLHFNEPNPKINALTERRLKVVTESEKFLKPYIALNSYSFSGANVHVLLKNWTKQKVNFGLPIDNLPRMICWAGRTEESVNNIFSCIENKKLDTEAIGLIHKIQSDSAPQMVFRGYGIFTKDENGNAKTIVKDVQHYSGIKRPVVWVFSGMGSQWAEMGTALMEIPLFRESILKCHNLLLPKGLNLIEIITSSDKKTFDNILHSFVGIASMQIALVDILRALKLEPQYIIGHSVGELACGYADGGLTAEQMILAAYSRGKVSLDAKKIKGSMAAVGVGYNEIIKLLPNTIEVACHNSSESSTISGPAEDVASFVAELKKKEIFAREVPCSEIAYHSKYIAQMGPYLLKYLSEIIPNPKPRSEKWLSSSVPKIDWEKPHAQLCSAEYHTNNLLNSVLFEETSDMLPRDALAIEIAPHGLLQAILKRSMSKAVHIGLTQRGHKNNAEFLLQSLGKIYLNGIDLPLDKLYPKIEFPVSRSTMNLSSLIKWDHAESWYVSTFEENKLDDTYEWNIPLNLQEQHKFLKEYYIEDKIILPASYLLEAVINFFAKTKNSSYQEMNIEISDVKFCKNIYVTEADKIMLNIMIHRGSGSFSITESHAEIMSGVIVTLTEAINPINIKVDDDSSDYAVLFKNDIYKELKMRGHNYNDFFKSVINARSNGVTGQLKWQNSLTSFLDGIIQIRCLKEDSRDPLVLKQIRKINIYGPNHQKDISNGNTVIDVNYNANYDLFVAGGFEIFGLECNHIDRKISKENIVLEKTEFLPNFSSKLITTVEALRCCLQIAIENSANLKMKIIEIDLDNNYEPIIQILNEALTTIPNVIGKCTLLTKKEIKMPGVQVEEGDISTHSNVTFIVTSELLNNYELASKIEKRLDNVSFVITQENLNLKSNVVKSPPGFNIINVFTTKNKCLYLLKKKENIRFNEAAIIEINECDDKFQWIKKIQNITNKDQPIILYSYNNKFNGTLGMMQCLRKDIQNKIFCFFINHEISPIFNIGTPVYENQLKLEMSVNVLQKGLWGTYRQILLDKNNTERSHKVHFGCNIDHPGDLATLNWYQGDLSLNDCNINVVYSSINFRDMLFAIGRLPIDMYNKDRMERKFLLGIEFSGVEIKTGKRIMGIVNKNGLSPYIRTNSRLIWDIPKYWSLKEAATVPLAYSTVYYALFTIIKIQKNKSILIHCGTGSVGLAAITVCLANDLEVYTTVSSDEKKEFLLKHFPQLKESHIGNSCNTSFEDMIQEHTNNKGVNYILNSLSGDKMVASTRCLATQGAFIELGKYDSQLNNKMGLGVFLREITYHAISLQHFLNNGSDQQINKLKDKINKDICDGIIKPFPSIVFKPNKIENAFRLIESRKYIGKILIEFRENSTSDQIHPINMLSQIYLNSNLSYIICDNFNGFGIEFVDWLVVRGARKLVLCLNGNEMNSYFKYRMSVWKKYGTKLVLHSDEIGDLSVCSSILSSAVKLLGEIGGIFILNNNFNNNKKPFKEQTISDFKHCVQSKSNVVQHMDVVSQKIAKQLKYFVVFSTIASIEGCSCQTSSAFANSICERIIENRILHNQPGLIVQWGPIKDNYDDVLHEQGILNQEIRSCLSQLDTILLSDDVITSSKVIDKQILNNNNKNYNYFDSIMKLFNCENWKLLPKDTKLFEIGLNSLASLEFYYIIQKKLDLKLNLKQIKSLTFLKLKELIDKETVTRRNDEKFIYTNETKDIQIILKQFDDVTNNYERLFTPPGKSTIPSGMIIIPGIEGKAGNKWLNIAPKLDSTTSFLQISNINGLNSIEEIVKKCLPDTIDGLKNSKTFFLIGYSFGALIALELASELEKLNYTGKILLIDGAPCFFKELINQNFNENFNEKDLYDTILSAIIIKMHPDENIDKLHLEFKLINSIANKWNKFLEYIKDQSAFTHEYVETMTKIIIERLLIIINYNKKNNINIIKSPITLVRPNEVSVVDIDEDYELSKLTNNKINICYIDGNHSTILNNSELIEIINECDPVKEEKIIFESFLQSDVVFEKDYRI